MFLSVFSSICHVQLLFSPCVCLSVCPSFLPPTHLSLCQPVHPSIRPCVCLPVCSHVCPYVCLWICLHISVHPFVCPSVCPFVCPSYSMCVHLSFQFYYPSVCMSLLLAACFYAQLHLINQSQQIWSQMKERHNGSIRSKAF
jgi:hypothetical protein